MSRHEAILGKALPWVDILHANYEEAEAIVGALDGALSGSDDHLRALAAWFLEKGVAVVSITVGSRGSFTAVTRHRTRIAASPSLGRQVAAWAGREVRAPAFSVGPNSGVNTNGAGDAFVGGLVLAAAVWKEALTLEEAVRFATLAALQRVDEKLRDAEVKTNAARLMAVAKADGASTAAAALPLTLPMT